MSKPYDLSKKSDMKRFEKDLKQTLLDKAKESFRNGLEIDYECPNCHNQIKIHVGNNTCPFCSQKIVVNL